MENRDRIPTVQIDESEDNPEAVNEERQGEGGGDYFSLDTGHSSSTSNPLLQHLHSRLAPLTPLQSPTVERPSLSPRNSSENAIPIYRGSYGKPLSELSNGSGPGSKPSSIAGNRHERNLSTTSLKSLKHTTSHVKIGRFFKGDTEVRDSFGLEELRDGFFDSVFVPPSLIEENIRKIAATGRLEEQQLNDKDRLSVRLKFKLKQLVRNCMEETNRKVLLKAFLAYFIAYILCLIGPTDRWLGPYSFLMPMAAIIHHPGRTVGSQLEITIQAIGGEAFGLGWSSLALFISTSTGKARSGYGGILAGSIVISLFISSWIRAHYIRLYHGSMAYCIIFILMHIVDVSDHVIWGKAWDIGIPYLMGVLLTLVISVIVFPDVGHIPIMNELHSILDACSSAISACGSRDAKLRVRNQQSLTTQGMNLSFVVREMTNEITLSTLSSAEVIRLRNKITTGISRIRAIPNPGTLFLSDVPCENEAMLSLFSSFSGPAERVISELSNNLLVCCKFLTYLKQGGETQTIVDLRVELKDSIGKLESAIETIADEYKLLAESKQNIFKSIEDHEVLSIMLYMHYLYEASKHIHQVCLEVGELADQKRRWKLSLPSYPLNRALKRTTARITHDRGGESAAYYFQSKRDVEESFRESYKLAENNPPWATERHHTLTDPRGVRYSLWTLVHRMQKYETRFALKASIAIVLVCIPAWLDYTSTWYARHHLWICSVVAYLALHPRVGGNARDFIARTSLSISGSLWGGIAYRAKYGNPYVLAVFCAIYMIPAFYRFLLTGHPRSGFVGCLAFTFVSLGIRPDENIFTATATKLAAIQIGVMVSIVISWIFWPFVARHEVRKSLASLLQYLSQSYQIVADRYLYKDENDNITSLTLQMSEVREARIIQNMNALEQLIELTNHEPSIRGDFEISVYKTLLQSCKFILQTITEARISSVYFNIYDNDPDEDTTRQLQSLRRDAVASVIFAFYILSNAFRSKNAIPRYIPSAVMSRKILFDAIEQLEYSLPQGKDRIWKLVHESAFSKAFTDITEELEKIIGLSKHILGEQTF